MCKIVAAQFKDAIQCDVKDVTLIDVIHQVLISLSQMMDRKKIIMLISVSCELKVIN